MLAPAIEPPGRDGALQQVFPTDPVVPIEQHGLDVQRLAVPAVDRDRAVGRLHGHSRAPPRRADYLSALIATFQYAPATAAQPQEKSGTAATTRCAGTSALRPSCRFGIPMSLAKLHVIPEDRVRQRLVIGRCTEQSAADHIAGIHGDVARDLRDLISVIVEVVGPQGRAGALVGQASDDADRVSVPLDRPAQRIGRRGAWRGGGRSRNTDNAVGVERRGDLGIHRLANGCRQVGGQELKPGQANRHAVRRGRSRPQPPPRPGSHQPAEACRRRPQSPSDAAR